MKWFKHMANARDDDFTEWLEETYGFEGVGRYWRILEIIAAEMDKHPNDPSATHTWTKWQTLLRGKRSQLLGYLSAIASRDKMKLVHDENILKITIPKMLELRDNHTRNLQATSKQLQSDLFLELEADKETDLKATPLPPQAPIPVPKLRKEEKRFNLDDFEAATAACCSLLSVRMLAPSDAALLMSWLKTHDFKTILFPIISKKIESFAMNNSGKRPASLQYFKDAIDEKAGRH